MRISLQVGLSIFLSVSFLGSGVAATVANERRLTSLKVIPTQVLRRSISPRFYKSLLISPLKGSVIVRATLSGSKLFGAKVVHSELNGLYDSLALDLAQKTDIAGYYGIESRVAPSILLHLLIYEIADGTMVLSFVNFDGAGGNQMEYYGCAKLMVHKNDGSWTEIKGPPSLQGKGYAVRQGLKNSFELQTKYALRIVPRGG
jgi:hypothetical protein